MISSNSSPSNSPPKRKRGRPKGSTKLRGPVVRNWQPLRWKPEYEKMILLSASGYTNKEIAQALRCTPQTVSNVLCSERGQEVLSIVVQKIRENSVKADVPKLMEDTKSKAAKRVNDLISDDEIYNKNPIGVASFATRLLEGSGVLNKRDPVVSSNVDNSQKSITVNQFNILKSAIEKSNDVNEIYGKGVELIVDGKPKHLDE